MENTTDISKIDVVILSKAEKFWTDFKEKTEEAIFNSHAEIEINKRIIALADEKLNKFAEDKKKE